MPKNLYHQERSVPILDTSNTDNSRENNEQAVRVTQKLSHLGHLGSALRSAAGDCTGGQGDRGPGPAATAAPPAATEAVAGSGA